MTMVGMNPEDYEELLATSLAGFERANASGFTDAIKVRQINLTEAADDTAQTIKIADVKSGDVIGPALLYIKTPDTTLTVNVKLAFDTDATELIDHDVVDAEDGDSIADVSYVAFTADDVLNLVLTPGTGEALADVTQFEVYVLYGHIPVKEFVKW